jgi:hypothetical protein
MKRFLSAAAVALTLLGAACDDAAVAPSPSQAQFSAASADLDALAKYRDGPPQIVIGFAMKAIGPAGGTISLAGFEVVVPKGAVSKWTNFTIRLPVDPNMGSYVWAEFGPHNVKFAQPVTLRVPYKGTTADGDETVHVMWYNGRDWIQLPSTLTIDGRIETLTDHFSEYGTEEAQPSKGITLGGG